MDLPETQDKMRYATYIAQLKLQYVGCDDDTLKRRYQEVTAEKRALAELLQERGY